MGNESKLPMDQLHEILLAYLEAAGIPDWPGGDGLTLQDALDYYPEAVANGVVPDWQEVRHMHPDLDPALHNYLARADRWEFAIRRRVPVP